MALRDWLWLVRLVMEILKLIAALPADDLKAIAKLRESVDLPIPADKHESDSHET